MPTIKNFANFLVLNWGIFNFSKSRHLIQAKFFNFDQLYRLTFSRVFVPPDIIWKYPGKTTMSAGRIIADHQVSRVSWFYIFVHYLKDWRLGLGKVRKLTEESVNEWQKPLIFKSSAKRISRFWKRLKTKTQPISLLKMHWSCKKRIFFMCSDVFKCCLLCSHR